MVDAKKYEGLPPEEFLQSIKRENGRFFASVKAEREKGNVPRYVASYEWKDGKALINVRLRFVPKESELGILKGTANKVLIRTSQRTPDEHNEHIIQSPGA